MRSFNGVSTICKIKLLRAPTVQANENAPGVPQIPTQMSITGLWRKLNNDNEREIIRQTSLILISIRYLREICNQFRFGLKNQDCCHHTECKPVLNSSRRKYQ
ncbi:hypothetical protein M758_6G188600 [Ceratodon purpureus]|nr:hypothetical protein M758_6G188600 [Ceratodon purpureus]